MSVERDQVASIPLGELTARRLDHHQRPVRVTDLAATASPLTPEIVVERAGDTEVPVTLIDRGEYMEAQRQRMALADYYERIAHPDRDTPIPYLAEISYDEYFPDLAAELIDPPELVGERFEQRVMYFGRLVHSQIHFHSFGSAMLFCLHGEKIVRLFAPDQTDRLYKAPHRNFSEVTVSSVGENAYAHDEERYPDFAGAEFCEVTVRAGDVLYIPIYWWHGIQNGDDISLSAVYFWSQSWRSSWRRYLPEQLPPAPMRGDYVRDLASQTKQRVQTRLGRS